MKKRNKKNQLNDIGKYSSLAFQMIAIIAGGIGAGLYADKHIDWQFPIFTLLASFISVPLAIYYSIKDFL